MRITKIEKEGHIYTVTFKPNWIEKILGFKEKNTRFKETGYRYTFGGGEVYVNEKGEKLGNRDWIGESIDNWKHKF